MEQQQRLTAIPEKTKSVTAWEICVWNDWAAACAATISETDRLIVTTPLLEMPVEDLAYWMGKFVLEARKMDSSEYPPETLYSLITAISVLGSTSLHLLLHLSLLYHFNISFCK